MRKDITEILSFNNQPMQHVIAAVSFCYVKSIFFPVYFPVLLNSFREGIFQT